MTTRWTGRADVPRGADYDERFEALAAAGTDVHGEATLVRALAEGTRILDAGCGTGRVAIELAAHGFAVTGIDIDTAMLSVARRKAPALTWVEGNLATTTIDDTFDLVVLAGNVMIFVGHDTEADVITRCADHLRAGGRLVSGFQLRAGGYGPDLLDAHADRAGLGLEHRWSTWDRSPWSAGGDYQVSVHRKR